MRASKSILIVAVLVGGVVGTSLASPFAVEVVSAQGPFGPSPYNDTNAVLGAPSTRLYDPFGSFGGGTTNRRVKLVEAAHNIAANTNGLLTPNLITTLNGGSHIIVRFDQPIYNDPVNPYGIDFLVFGNAFYSPNGFVNDSTDMNTNTLRGGLFGEPVKVSVSPGYTASTSEVPTDPDTWPWYRYEDSPYGDTDFPTQAFQWNRAATNWTDEVMNFTKPVNPALKQLLSAGGMTVADAIDLYVGSGGGTGFDLQLSGFSWIQYVKVEGIDPDFSDGEIDAFSIVRPMTLGDEMSIAPENITNNTPTLFFQKPGQTTNSIVTLDFTEIAGVAKVTTAQLDNPSALAPLHGTSLNAVQLGLSSLPGTNAVTFRAGLTLNTGENYASNGEDLDVVQWSGSNWVRQAFTFDSPDNRVLLTGVTNLSAFVVIQIYPPTLTMTTDSDDLEFSVVPVPGWKYTLERTTDFTNWPPVATITATDGQELTFTDANPPPDGAFYRLRMERQ